MSAILPSLNEQGAGVYFNAKEAARLLGVSRQRLGCYLREGRIEGAYDAGDHRGWQIPKAALMSPILSKWKGRTVGGKVDADAMPTERRGPGRPRKTGPA